MKKIFTISVIILLSAMVLMAQDNKKKNPVSGGLYLKGGVSWTMSDSKALLTKNKAKLSYGFGATMDWNFSQNFSLNISAGLCNLGGTTEFKYGLVDLTDDDKQAIPSVGDTLMHSYKFSTSYIEVPIGIKGCTNEIGYFTYFLKLGADPMFRIKSKVTPKIDDADARTITKSTNLLNIGWFVGGGFEWALAGNTKLVVELVYLGTFFDFDKAKSYKEIDGKLTEFNPSIKFNDISLKVGVVF
jgi:hypothetical protein